MNAGGVSKACKSYVYFGTRGKRESNTLVIYPRHEDNPGKLGIILNSLEKTQVFSSKGPPVGEEPMAYQLEGAGKSPPWQRRVAGVRAWSASLGLRHCPDSYGRLQSRIFLNGRKAEGATPRAGRRPSGCKLLFYGKNP